MARIHKGATRHEESKRKPVISWRRFSGLLLGVSLLSAALWGVAQLLSPETLPVRTVRVENRLHHLDSEVLRRAVVAHAKDGFVRVDVAAIQQELEALPWVATASVRRSWPDMLIVRVQEQQPVARWSDGGLLNPEGERFAVAETASWQSLPVLQGPKETEKAVMKEYQTMQQELAQLDLQIVELRMDQRRAWSVRLDNGLQLRLGRGDKLSRLKRFANVYASVLQPRLASIDSVDLRYTNGFAVRWRDGNAAV